MEVNAQVVLPVTDASHAGDARRRATEFARLAGFDEQDAGRVAIVATEAATNLAKHAQGGEILLGRGGAEGGRSIRLVALDRGPGIANVAESMRDGFSTAGSPGTGLGAIRRIATRFDLYSDGGGTALACEVTPPVPRAPTPEPLLVGAVCVPVAGEDVCGDAWEILPTPHPLVCVVDGLGHGPGAAAAALATLDLLRRNAGRTPVEIIRSLHDGLRSTRGAAASVAQLDTAKRIVRFAGIGNVAGSVITDGTVRHMVTHYGTLGHDLHRVDEFTYPWPRGATVVLHSDGIGSRWDLGRYPGLLERHPTLVAAVLYRDFRRSRDDATVVAVREPR